MAWITAGAITNPAANAILADTGALSADQTSYSKIYIVLASSVAINVTFEHRNETNASNVNSQVITVPAFGTQTIDIPVSIDFPIAAQRLRVRANSAVTGVVQASLFVQ